MKLVIAFFFSGMLLVPAVAQQNPGAHDTGSAVTRSHPLQSGDGEIRSSQMLALAGSPDGEAYPLATSDNNEGTITVDVWAPATSVEVRPSETEPGKLSPDFAVAALQAAFRMQSTERKIENSIRRGFPVGEFWIRTDIEGIDDSLMLAALSAKNDTDREALRQLRVQSGRLRLWSDWLIDANQKMDLGNYLTSSGALDNDERFQNTVTCTTFLVSMLASRSLGEDSSCR